MNNVVINISNVTKQFGPTVALDGVSMRFDDGNLYGVIGPAGAGKTTLFRLMLRLLKSGGGDIEYSIGGHPISFNDFSENIAYMPQSQSLYSDLSVSEHLEFFKRLYGIDDAEYRRRRDELVHLTRLEKFLSRPAGKLSGGMYKKLGLMCALLRSPRVMLLDEPTNGVDPISRREFWNLLHASTARGILVIISTAYMDEAERCNRVILMERGRVLGDGGPAELLQENGCANFDDFFLMRGGEK
ncbi:ABC transporter ATP-binding protein [bacterium]|nr:ABC transporter ATP-binding protein [bacterium]